MTNAYYEISQGQGSKMYTLWLCRTDNAFAGQSFIKNLSIDKEKALAEAHRLAKKNGITEVFDESIDNLRITVRKGDGLMPVGKYYGQPISQLDDGYLCWLAEGGQIRTKDQDDDNNTYVKYLAEDYIKDEAMKICLEKGLYVEFEGKVISAKFKEWIVNDRLGWGHHANDKDKLELTLKLLKRGGYQSAFGYVSIYTFVDVNTGNKYQYKGGNPPSKKVIETHDGKEYSWSEVLNPGDIIDVKGTVKLSEYNGQQITYIQRIKTI
jgi:hypothetical protein